MLTLLKPFDVLIYFSRIKGDVMSVTDTVHVRTKSNMNSLWLSLNTQAKSHFSNLPNNYGLYKITSILPKL